jgi:hypothetical protein
VRSLVSTALFVWHAAAAQPALAAAQPAPAAAQPAPAAAQPAPAAPQQRPRLAYEFMFGVSSLTGAVPSSWARLAYDRERDELFVTHGGVVRIFNRLGMEVYSFGADGDLGYVTNVALLENGDLVVLSYVDGVRQLIRCNYRGELIETIEPRSLPRELKLPFQPDAVVVRGGSLYLAETGNLRVVVLDPSGAFQRYYPLGDILGLDPKARREAAFGGFDVDGDGNLLFTIPTLFTAFVVSPKGQIMRTFGVRGSSPGRFNIVGKLVRDDTGHSYLLDRLRSVVMVFDADLSFLGEFGYRGDEPENLVAPYDIAVGNGKVFVSQARNRGVSVFKVTIQ